MNLTQQVRIVSMEEISELSIAPAPPVGATHHRLAAPLRSAILRTRQWLLGRQHSAGYWEGELEGDTILESEYILLLAYLGKEKTELAQQAARYLAEQQLPDGGWTMYPGGKLDINGSVKAYFALKLTGHDPSCETMQRARNAILAHGGADRVNSFTRFYLALLGQISYEQCPAVPPEVTLLPKWFPIHLGRVSAWSRTILVPLSIMSAHQPVKQIEPRRGIRELFIAKPENWPPLRCPGQTSCERLLSWARFFRLTDRGLKFAQRHGLLPFRKRAIAQAERWMLERFEESDGLGAIFPPIVWSIIALDCLGYAQDSSEMQYGHKHLEDLIIQDDDTTRLQPCKSPIWDTAITLRALAESGMEASHPAVAQATDWLLSREVRCQGDWADTVRAEPGGWFFEHNNAHYPDVDDTAMVLMALRQHWIDARPLPDTLPPGLQLVSQQSTSDRHVARQEVARNDRVAAASQRAIAWIVAMQNRDGGWGAFDRNNDSKFLCQVPFADHNAMIDPSTPDLAGRVLDALGAWGYRVPQLCVDRAVAYLRRTQEADGSWQGRWGVNYIYGTWQVLAGLAAVGVTTDDSAIATGADWLLAYQQPDGSWGESADSYADPSLRGQGPPTASQTAWALLGLMAAGLQSHPAMARGIRYLLETQQEDGSWDEPEFTGTGFPQVFYLRYHMYPIYFPLMALSRWAVALGSLVEQADTARIRLAECSTVKCSTAEDSTP